MGNILKHNRPTVEARMAKDDYWDMHLHKTKGGGRWAGEDGGMVTDCLDAYIDTDDPDCVIGGSLVSAYGYAWDKAKNEGLTLNNIGLTGMDNGLIRFDRDAVTREEFEDLFLRSAYEIDAGDTRLHLEPVGGNNKRISYKASFAEEDGHVAARLEGGFFQGFYRIGDGCTYGILPDAGRDGLAVQIVAKRADFLSKEYAERDKFSESEYASDGYDGGPAGDRYATGYSDEEYAENSSLPTLNDLHPENRGMILFIGARAEDKWARYDGVLGPSAATDDGIPAYGGGDRVVTDNKFVTYSRADGDITARDADRRDDAVAVEPESHDGGGNLFVTAHRGCGGVTARDLAEGRGGADKAAAAAGIRGRAAKDIARNAIGFQVRDDGSVGYKYAVEDCGTEDGFGIVSEWSFPGAVPMSKWSCIDIRIIPLRQAGTSSGTMLVMMYVDGRLVLCSMELPALDIRPLGCRAEVQEAVPFNISVGGGTQGLCDAVYEDFETPYVADSPLEEAFGGSFEGFVRSVKIYSCGMDYEAINRNVRFSAALYLHSSKNA